MKESEKEREREKSDRQIIEERLWKERKLAELFTGNKKVKRKANN